MKIAYFDCQSGISGDMTLAALLDLGADLATVQAGIASLGLPRCVLRTVEVKRKGFRANQLLIEHEPEHKHRHLHHIEAMIGQSVLTPRQKELALKIFVRLAEAEARVHGSDIQKVHFHEVGAVDSIADIVGTAIAFDLLAIEQVMASSVPTGTGFVKIAHGTCSIPAPATAEILRGVPVRGTHVEAELTTPTGAAILATLANRFGPVPDMTVQAIGYGAGQRELAEQPNILRVLLGQGKTELPEDRVWVLETNLDDVSGEWMAHCTSELLAAGMLDVYTTAVQMKKGRPGILLTVLCEESLLPTAERIVFSQTTTLGVRRWPVERTRLRRAPKEVVTSFGPVLGKLAWLDEAKPTFSPEFEACAQLAKTHQVALKDIYEAARVAFAAERAAAHKHG